MAAITEDYISFEVAKLLKEKGFNERLFTFYTTDEAKKEGYFELMAFTDDKIDNNHSDYCYLAPTLQMAMKWLREVHNIHISVYVFNRELPITNVPIFYTCDIATKKLSSQQGHLRGMWNTYEQACEAAIKYCLENLI